MSTPYKKFKFDSNFFSAKLSPSAGITGCILNDSKEDSRTKFVWFTKIHQLTADRDHYVCRSHWAHYAFVGDVGKHQIKKLKTNLTGQMKEVKLNNVCKTAARQDSDLGQSIASYLPIVSYLPIIWLKLKNILKKCLFRPWESINTKRLF